jgi:DNA-directed RNA polymerase specialized sigma24 family protein
MTYLKTFHDGSRLDPMAPSRKSEITEIVERNYDELRWLAEVILGHEQNADMCIVRAGQLVEAEGVVARDWLESWVKRCLVRAAIERIRIDVQRVASDYTRHSRLAVTLPVLNSTEKQTLRSVKSGKIFGVCNVLERVALILHAYLEFSAQDSALLLDCPRAVIEPACTNALQEILKRGLMPKLALMELQ